MSGDERIEYRRGASVCLTSAVVMLAVGSLFFAGTKLFAPSLDRMFLDHPEIFRPWPIPTLVYMVAYALAYGTVFGAAYLFLQRRLQLAGGVISGLQYGLLLWVVGSAPIFLLMYASAKIPGPIVVAWILQNLVQYLVTGSTLGAVAGGARVEVSSTFPAPAERLWELIRQKSVFLKLTDGMVQFTGTEQWPDRPFETGAELSTTVSLFGWGPTTKYRIKTLRSDAQIFLIETEERGGAIESWRHRMQIVPLGSNSCRYIDSIHIQAGWQTPLIWCFARWFYSRRHRRLQQIVASL